MKLLKTTMVLTLSAVMMLSTAFSENSKLFTNKKDVNNINKQLTEKRQNLPPFTTPQHINVGRTEDFTLVMTDSWGDGWDGAFMSVYVNGSLVLQDITVPNDGGFGAKTICFPDQPRPEYQTLKLSPIDKLVREQSFELTFLWTSHLQ